MKIAVKDIKGNNQGELEVKFALVENGKGTQAVHDAVVAYQAAQRMGTACTKNVGETPDKNLSLASRNVPNVTLTTSDSLNTYDVLRPDKLVFTRGAFEQVEARLAKE